MITNAIFGEKCLTHFTCGFNFRLGYRILLDGSKKGIETAILGNVDKYRYTGMNDQQIRFYIRQRFHERWAKHQCEAVGCGYWLVCDGGFYLDFTGQPPHQPSGCPDFCAILVVLFV